MSKRIKYDIGDVFEFRVDEDSKKVYGRIMKLNKPSIFIELYEFNSLQTLISIEELGEAKVFMSVWCTDNGFKKKLWNIIGNIPVIEEVKIPDFWTTDAFTGKIMLVRGEEKIEITEDQIGDLIPAGIYGHEAVRKTYILQLKKKGLPI